MIKTILFDLDGTIIDSEVVALESIVHCTKEWGVPVTRAEAASVAGRKWEVAFDLLYARHKIPVPRDVASKQITDYYKEQVRKNLVVVPGAVEAIQDFSKHFRLALVTGSLRRDALWALEKLKVDHHFEAVLGAENYGESKPAPDGYLKALSIMETRPEEALVFEDSAAGIASAMAAGVKVVAIESTNHFGHDQADANARIRDFVGIGSDWVKKTFP